MHNMDTKAQQAWFASCMRNWNRRKEEELTKAWSKLILKGGAFVLGGIVLIKWLIG